MLLTLQAGRALATLAVVSFHLSIMMGEKRYGGVTEFNQYTKHLHFGVEFFFVLSGFIIIFTHIRDINNPQAWGNYIYKRFVRIYPIYWIYTSLFILIFLIIGGTNAKLPTSMIDWITSISLIHFSDATPPLPQAWTLFNEVAFYGLFSILILNRRIGFILFTLLLLFCLYLYNSSLVDTTPLNIYNAKYNLYFIFGMGAYGLYHLGGSGKIEFLFGLCVTALAFITMPLPFGLTSIFLGLGFAVLLSGLVKLELSNSIQIPIFLSLIGNASYSIYLTHSNVIGVLLKFSETIQLSKKIGFGGIYFFALSGTIILGCFIYLIIEKNVVKFFRDKRV